jgi:hypothetical protein
MKTIHIDYPINYSFKTKKTFNSNEERTKYLHQVLRRNKIESPCHDYTDYLVENVDKLGCYDTEYWCIGS